MEIVKRNAVAFALAVSAGMAGVAGVIGHFTLQDNKAIVAKFNAASESDQFKSVKRGIIHYNCLDVATGEPVAVYPKTIEEFGKVKSSPTCVPTHL